MKGSRTTLTSSIWDEWTAGPVAEGEKPREEIRGIFEGLHTEERDGGSIVYSSSRLWVFRRLRTLWSSWEEARDFDFASLLSIPPSLKGKVFFRLPPQLLTSLDHESGGRGMEWLKGLWGSCGSLYLPKTGYYLCFRISSKQTEERTVRLLKKKGFSFGKRRIQEKFEITIRNQQEIVDILARFHMFKTTLLLEEKAILRSLRNQANKLVNCDASNIRKSLEAASRQIEIARTVLEFPDYREFPAVLKQLVTTRLENPSATLEELGRMQSPPVSKSTVKNRWKKIESHIAPLSQRRKGAFKTD